MKLLPILTFAALAMAHAQITQDPPQPAYTNDVNYLRARKNKVVPGVYVCKGPGWQNGCTWQPSKKEACVGLPDSNTVALGPDIGIQCRVYEKADCKGLFSKGNLVTPGETNFKGYQGNQWIPKSYRCKPCPPDAEDCGSPGVTDVDPWDPKRTLLY